MGLGITWYCIALRQTSAATDSGTHTRTQDLAPLAELNENDGDVGDLTRMFLLAFSHWVFYFILNLFFLPLYFIALRIYMPLSTNAIQS